MKKMVINYIYVLKCPLSREIVYVGKTKNPKKREKDHHRKCSGKYRSRLDKWKSNIIKNGNLPIMEIIKECNIDVDYWEKYYIKEYRKEFNLLNMTEGGDGLQNPSDEVRKKIGDKSRGRKKSDKTRKILSEKLYNKTGKRILCYDKSGNLISEYRNSRRASEDLNISHKLISKVLNKVYHFTNGYTFFYKDEPNIDKKIKYRSKYSIDHHREFYRISKNGELKLYDNIISAADSNNVNYRNLWSCLSNTRKTCGGYAWQYFDNYNGEYKYFFKRKGNSKKISNNGNIYNSLKEASEVLNISPAAICKYLKDINNTDWEYITQSENNI